MNGRVDPAVLLLRTALCSGCSQSRPGLRLDLERYLRHDNTERAHTGRWTHGRTPEAILGKAKLWQKRR